MTLESAVASIISISGLGSPAIAYIGGIQGGLGADQFTNFNEFDLQVNGGQGNFYRHTLDVRLGDINFLFGKLKLVVLGSYMRGGNFTTTDGANGHVDNSGGVGGGIVQQWDLPPQFGKLSYVQLGLLYGWGLVDFDAGGPTLGKLNNAYNSALAGDNNAPNGTFESVDPYNNSQRARANAFWVWNPTDNFSMGVWGAIYQFDDQGFAARKVNANGTVSSTSEDAHVFTFGVRPVWWIWGPFALQGQAVYSYLSNVRDPGVNAFGNSGSMGIFTIAPTIKPRGGYFTRPEIRLYATLAVWSDSLKGAIGSPILR